MSQNMDLPVGRHFAATTPKPVTMEQQVFSALSNAGTLLLDRNFLHISMDRKDHEATSKSVAAAHVLASFLAPEGRGPLYVSTWDANPVTGSRQNMCVQLNVEHADFVKIRDQVAALPNCYERDDRYEWLSSTRGRSLKQDVAEMMFRHGKHKPHTIMPDQDKIVIPGEKFDGVQSATSFQVGQRMVDMYKGSTIGVNQQGDLELGGFDLVARFREKQNAIAASEAIDRFLSQPTPQPVK